jgi:eukaryotic-like serine/threonine-protein kinase
MSLTPGTRVGPYEITALIGEGGMGKVWRAHHTALKRDDALKVLPDAFASDPDRLARFRREAQVLASLNHPNIAHVYGLEQADGVQALVMELVEGPTLADQIAQGPIAVDEALPIARQIAEALEAAHEQGIIHRDLKPANIKVRLDSTVKVLDFGLAKALEPTSARSIDATASPTITSPALMTGVGVLLGTAAYMSPEQAKGHAADRRSDVWAFGCVLFEMLTGRRAFEGEDVSDTLAAVLRGDPTWRALPPDLPPRIRTLIKRCLDRDRKQRIAEISTARFVLEEAAEPSQPTITGVPPVSFFPSSPLWKRAAALSTLVVAAALVGGAVVWFALRSSVSSPRVSRLQFTPSGSAALSINGNDPDLAITRDGTRIVYIGSGQVFVRALDALEPVVIARGSPRGPFISPDGQWVGFVDSNTTLKRVAITGGPSVTLVRFDGTGSRGATWGPDDSIIFATNSRATGLQRVAATGGTPTVLTKPDRAQGELDHLWPEMLPGGRAVLFTITAPGGLDAGQVAVLDLETGTRKVLVRGASQAHYVPTGHLVYAAAGTFSVVGFDLDRLETRGTPVPVVPEVVIMGSGGIDAVVADNGTLAYVPGGGGVAGAQRTLVWVDRQGQETSITAPARAFVYPRIAPDGTRVAVYSNDQGNDTRASASLSYVSNTVSSFVTTSRSRAAS